jgi:dipeptidase E
MRLYLSSFRNGDHVERLRALRRTDRPVAVIANAIDVAPEDVRRDGVQGEFERLGAIGLACEEVDLRDFVDAGPGELEARLREFEVVWLRGGNVFALRYVMARSGADDAFRRLLAEDALVYAGYSAGPCCLAPSLRGLELCDDVDVVPRLYNAEPIWEGLGVLEEAFVPHLDTPEHPETELLARVAELYERTGVPHLRLRDGQVYVVDGDRRELL